jgi:translation initiation factor 6
MKMSHNFDTIGFYGNPFIGLFLKSNNLVTLMPVNSPTKFSRITEILGTKQIKTTAFDSPLVGLYSAMNNKGIVLASIFQNNEIENIKRELKMNRIELNLAVLETESTALSNNIVCNDRSAIINPKIKEKNIIKLIQDTLDVEVIDLELERYKTVGSVIFANNKGFVAHPSLTDEELDKIEEILGVNGGVGTANSGVPFVSICMTGNDNGVIFGEATTAFEQQRIIDALGLM